jgi:hypothetical protein
VTSGRSVAVPVWGGPAAKQNKPHSRTAINRVLAGIRDPFNEIRMDESEYSVFTRWALKAGPVVRRSGPVDSSA